MTKVIGLVFAALASTAHFSPALGQTLCEVIYRQNVRFPDCSNAGTKRMEGKIGITGKVNKIAWGMYCKSRLSVEVLQSSMDDIPPVVEIDFDPGLESAVKEGDVVNVYVWQRPGPNSDAYALAPCPNRL